MEKREKVKAPLQPCLPAAWCPHDPQGTAVSVVSAMVLNRLQRMALILPCMQLFQIKSLSEDEGQNSFTEEKLFPETMHSGWILVLGFQGSQ